jgi:hypothetical protein
MWYTLPSDIDNTCLCEIYENINYVW